MKSTLRILHLEDNDLDAAIIRSLLDDKGVGCRIERVQGREDFAAALERDDLDLILSDFSLPDFDGLSALALAQKRRPETPFLFVSGTIGEEVAIEALKNGAMDYVLKERLLRLVPAIRRAIAEAEERAALKRAEDAMIQSEFKYRQLFECLSEAALLMDAGTGRILDTNRQAELLFGRGRAEIVGMNQDQLHPEAMLKRYRRGFAGTGTPPERVCFEGEILLPGNRRVPVSVSAAPLLLYGHRLIVGLYRDITNRKRNEEEIRKLREQMVRAVPRAPKAERKAAS
jgi:PAS domain S-box-containing protein